MNVHIIATPDVEPSMLNAVLENLNNIKGPMEFKIIKLFWHGDALEAIGRERIIRDYHFNISSEFQTESYDAQRGYPLSWREFFFLCEKTRRTISIPDEDFVIVLTGRRNSLNFFSVFADRNRRNAFVQTSDWEKYLKSSPEFPVAYEIVANVLRILMRCSLSDPLEKYFHLDSIGCINDFCENKKEILLKVRTADICPKCIAVLKSFGTEDALIIHALRIMENIRINMKFSQGLVGIVRPQRLEISYEGEITVGDKDLKLTPLEKALFIFFLKHPEGIRISELVDYEAEIFGVYQHLKPDADVKNIRNLVSYTAGNYQYNKSRLSTKIKNTLGEDLSRYYLITGTPGEKFGISLPTEFIKIKF